MKKALLIVLALLISVAFVSNVFAQAKPGEETKATEGKPAPVDTGHPGVVKAGPAVSAGAARPEMFKGTVVSFDAAAKTLVVKGKKGEKTFDVSMAKKMPKGLKAGDKVSLNYVEKDGKLIAGNIDKAGAKLPKKGKQEAISAGAPAPKEAPEKAEPAKPAEPEKK
ncbi:MAG: hypothetical protein A4E65_02227 [Syntrophorhabdus sp. PtaU1.Bin153]|nr:MAG: hypothetical protein A4E65_02227 [Syntrophorhabdus sp. PtaU1.Bin153]